MFDSSCLKNPRNKVPVVKKSTVHIPTMKRPRENDSDTDDGDDCSNTNSGFRDEDDEDASEQNQALDHTVRESDQRVFRRLHEQLAKNSDDDSALSNDISKQQRETCQRYYTSYMEKVINKLPIGRSILEALQLGKNDESGPEAFFTMFSAAKTVVHTEMQFQKLKAFNSVFDLGNAIVGKYIHNQFVKPMVNKYTSHERLDQAFEAYQSALTADDASTTLELQCVLHLVQSELESKSTLKVPHPMMNRFSQQMKAVSHYVLKVLTAVSTQENPDWTMHHQGGNSDDGSEKNIGSNEEEPPQMNERETVDDSYFTRNGEKFVVLDGVR